MKIECMDEMAEILDQLHIPTQTYEVTASYVDIGEEHVQRSIVFIMLTLVTNLQ